MSASQNSGTAQDWIEFVEQNHYLSVNTSGWNSDNDRYVIYWDDPVGGGEVVGIEVQYDNTQLSVGAGDGVGGVSSLQFNDQFWQSNNTGWVTQSTPTTWWWDAGSDYFWTVARANGTDDDGNTYDRTRWLGWQTVDEHYPYAETYDASRIATFYSNQGGWQSFASIDHAGDAGPLKHDSGNTASPQAASLTEGSTWLVHQPTHVAQTLSGRSLVGTVDAWGVDAGTSRPQHRDTITCGTTTFEYIAPGTADSAYFFKVT